MVRIRGRMSKTSKLSQDVSSGASEEKQEGARITVFNYNETSFLEKTVKKIEESFPYKDLPGITWINIDSIDDVDIIEKIGNQFNLHPLILEDIVITMQRPKIEYMGDYLFVALKMIQRDMKTKEIMVEQFSLILGENYVISFQEKEGDMFDGIRERIRKGKGRIRKEGADYLAYSLMDATVDGYFTILEKLSETIEAEEEELVKNPKPEMLSAIHIIKRDMIILRRSIWPLREVISALQREEATLIKPTTKIYLKDLYDHTIQVIDTVEAFRDMVAGMLDVYLSSISNKMNEVMKFLTIFASIFIPLTFIASIYGMNFKHMPELDSPLGYYGALGLMALVAITLVLYFKRKKWF